MHFHIASSRRCNLYPCSFKLYPLPPAFRSFADGLFPTHVCTFDLAAFLALRICLGPHFPLISIPFVQEEKAKKKKMGTHELKSNTSITSRGRGRETSAVRDRDNAQLQRMGKKPVLKVGSASFGVTWSDY